MPENIVASYSIINGLALRMTLVGPVSDLMLEVS